MLEGSEAGLRITFLPGAVHSLSFSRCEKSVLHSALSFTGTPFLDFILGCPGLRFSSSLRQLPTESQCRRLSVTLSFNS